MVTNHLRAPYDVYLTKNRTILWRPAGGRKNRTIFYQIFIHRSVRWSLGTTLNSTAPVRRLVGSTGVKWHRPAFAHIGRAPGDFCLKFISYDSNGARPGIVWCLTSTRNIKKSLNKLADALPGTGRCFMSRTATCEKQRVFAEEHLHRYFISKDQKHKYK